jgi:hypothetical protein
MVGMPAQIGLSGVARAKSPHGRFENPLRHIIGWNVPAGFGIRAFAVVQGRGQYNVTSYSVVESSRVDEVRYRSKHRDIRPSGGPRMLSASSIRST